MGKDAIFTFIIRNCITNLHRFY